MLSVQRIIATFSHISSETEYNALLVINYAIFRGRSSLSVCTIGQVPHTHGPGLSSPAGENSSFNSVRYDYTVRFIAPILLY